MSYCIAYLRVSTLDQSLASQRQEIQRFADYQRIEINEWIELEMSSRKDQSLRRIHELQDKLHVGDILITSELSRLGRSTVEVIQLVDNLVKSGVRVIIIRLGLDNENDSKLKPFQKLLLDVFSALSEMERELISIRTKEGLLVAKAAGNIGGRRKGTFYLSKYDKHLPKIQEYLTDKHPLSSIIKLIKEGTVDSLSDYLASRNIRAKKKVAN